MKLNQFFMITSLCAFPVLSGAQIFRCDTPSGPVFSDERCGETARIVELKDETRGIGGGYTEGVRPGLSDRDSERGNTQKTPDSQAVIMPVRVETTAASDAQSSTQKPGQMESRRPQIP